MSDYLCRIIYVDGDLLAIRQALFSHEELDTAMLKLCSVVNVHVSAVVSYEVVSGQAR